MDGATQRCGSHWERVHSGSPAEGASWWQKPESLWLDLFGYIDLAPDDRIVDVGAGSSLLVDALVADGCRDVTVLDVSPSALDRVEQRLPAGAVTCVVADVRTFRARSPFRVWHDRAVWHFLVQPQDRDAYRASLRANLSVGGFVIAGAFAPDGPERCSGLPVVRYSPAQLLESLDSDLELLHAEGRIHVTPTGAEQPFSVVVARRAQNGTPAS